MKNLKRLFLLIALAFLASKVLFSDFNSAPDTQTIIAVTSVASK